jgi:hypothetical protein
MSIFSENGIDQQPCKLWGNQNTAQVGKLASTHGEFVHSNSSTKSISDLLDQLYSAALLFEMLEYFKK